ncbi:MAG: META domain-containing protein [Hyphomonadaceae bacterium]|nr:META domain-containing protein [Hyphomonadaceae bacterium]MBX3510379.1 META domain-containing protein [Hyphomonadaceae bacterium]
MRRLTPRASLAAACMASGLIAGACASLSPNTDAPISELTGSRWVAEAINGAPVAPASAPEIAFAAEDRLSGTSGCNAIFGFYEAEAGLIAVRGLGHTERACAEPIMTQEQAFLAVLHNAARYERGADVLVIRDRAGQALTFRALR